MSKLLIKEPEASNLRRLQAQLTGVGKKTKPKNRDIVISLKDAGLIANLIQTILIEKPVVVDDYVTPNEAAELAGISRPLIVDMLRKGRLTGHKVGTKHWRVNKVSLLEYINSRDQAFRAESAIDEAGFGLD